MTTIAQLEEKVRTIKESLIKYDSFASLDRHGFDRPRELWRWQTGEGEGDKVA
jgi:hypothetical protein